MGSNVLKPELAHQAMDLYEITVWKFLESSEKKNKYAIGFTSYNTFPQNTGENMAQKNV